MEVREEYRNTMTDVEILESLKSYTAKPEILDRAIKALTCNSDCISRQALLDDLGVSEKTRKWGGDHSGYDTMMLYEIQDMIESQTPITPQEPKTGHWIEKDDYLYVCSECGQYIYSETEHDLLEFHAFCGRCGAKMIEPQERED